MAIFVSRLSSTRTAAGNKMTGPISSIGRLTKLRTLDLGKLYSSSYTFMLVQNNVLAIMSLTTTTNLILYRRQRLHRFHSNRDRTIDITENNKIA